MNKQYSREPGYEFQFAIALPRSFNPTWQCLKDLKSVKAAIVSHLAAIHNCSSVEKFVSDYEGHGKDHFRHDRDKATDRSHIGIPQI